MFPFRWSNSSEPMWSPGWTSSPMTPRQAFNSQGQFCGGDPNYQQSQAQTQAHLNALQPQNALLNQQLHNQTMTHIHHLQQLIPHQQSSQQTPSIPTPPLHQPLTTPTPVQPEPQPSMVTPPSQPSNPPTFDPEQILSQMKQKLTDDLVAAVEKANERNSQFLHPTPPTTTTPHSATQIPPSNSHVSHTAQSSHRSRSPPHPTEPHRGGKRPVSIPRSPRSPRSHVPSRRHHPESSPHGGRDHSVTLRSVSPD